MPHQHPYSGRKTDRMEKTKPSSFRSRCFLVAFLAIFSWLLFTFHFWFLGDSREAIKSFYSESSKLEQTTGNALASRLPASDPWLAAIKKSVDKGNDPFDPCRGRYIYMHKIPDIFNEGMLRNCSTLSPWTNMCKYTQNDGLGAQIEDTEGVFSTSGWFETYQFLTEVIFHSRMKQYVCLTEDAEKATAFYVPFYPGLDVARHLWGFSASVRDAAGREVTQWLSRQKEWGLLGGRDHFMVVGRITWDFRRLSGEDSDWGSNLLELPATKNMSILIIEKSSFVDNEFSIPYPTYFHPSREMEVIEWQRVVRSTPRPVLFAFAGGSRPGIASSIRGQIIEQCKTSKRCRLLECPMVEKVATKCHKPSRVMKLFKEAVFCLQPQGDSYTRRSIFDSMLAGCIPVFFHPDSAYSQYVWHLPQDHKQYSVFIPEEDIRNQTVSIEGVLSQIPPQDVARMRNTVIELIPGITYTNPRHRLESVNDAFDISVQAVVRKINALKQRILENGGDVGQKEGGA